MIPFRKEEETMDRNPSDSTTDSAHVYVYVTPSTSTTYYIALVLSCDVACMSADVASSLLVRVGCVPLLGWNWVNSKAHLSCRNELKGSQCGLQVGGVCLEVVESASDAGLKLGWLLTGWARGRDLVEGTHDCGCRETESFQNSRKTRVEFHRRFGFVRR